MFISLHRTPEITNYASVNQNIRARPLKFRGRRGRNFKGCALVAGVITDLSATLRNAAAQRVSPWRFPPDRPLGRRCRAMPSDISSSAAPPFQWCSSSLHLRRAACVLWLWSARCDSPSDYGLSALPRPVRQTWPANVRSYI